MREIRTMYSWGSINQLKGSVGEISITLQTSIIIEYLKHCKWIRSRSPLTSLPLAIWKMERTWIMGMNFLLFPHCSLPQLRNVVPLTPQKCITMPVLLDLGSWISFSSFGHYLPIQSCHFFSPLKHLQVAACLVFPPSRQSNNSQEIDWSPLLHCGVNCVWLEELWLYSAVSSLPFTLSWLLLVIYFHDLCKEMEWREKRRLLLPCSSYVSEFPLL